MALGDMDDIARLQAALAQPGSDYDWSTDALAEVTHPAETRTPPSVKAMILANILAGIADMVTTEMGVRTPGLREGNPLMRNQAARLVLKPAVVGGTSWLANKWGKEGKTGPALAAAGIPAAISALAAGLNMGRLGGR